MRLQSVGVVGINVFEDNGNGSESGHSLCQQVGSCSASNGVRLGVRTGVRLGFSQCEIDSQLKDVSAHFCLSGTQQKQQIEQSAITASSMFAQLARPPCHDQRYSRPCNSCVECRMFICTRFARKITNTLCSSSKTLSLRQQKSSQSVLIFSHWQPVMTLWPHWPTTTIAIVKGDVPCACCVIMHRAG